MDYRDIPNALDWDKDSLIEDYIAMSDSDDQLQYDW